MGNPGGASLARTHNSTAADGFQSFSPRRESLAISSSSSRQKQQAGQQQLLRAEPPATLLLFFCPVSVANILETQQSVVQLFETILETFEEFFFAGGGSSSLQQSLGAPKLGSFIIATLIVPILDLLEPILGLVGTLDVSEFGHGAKMV